MLRLPFLVLTTALTCGALLLTTEPALAQHGHGHGQGGHGSGHGHGQAHGGHGYGHGHGGYGYSGHGHSYPYASFGFGLSVYPAYNYPRYSYGYPRYYPAYDPVYYGSSFSGVYSSAGPVQPRLGPATAPVALANGGAGIDVRLPDPEAQVWIDGARTSSTGRTRIYESPGLDLAKTYVYTVTAAWNQGGRVVTEERQVDVAAGRITVVDFTRSQASATK